VIGSLLGAFIGIALRVELGGSKVVCKYAVGVKVGKDRSSLEIAEGISVVGLIDSSINIQGFVPFPFFEL